MGKEKCSEKKKDKKKKKLLHTLKRTRRDVDLNNVDGKEQRAKKKRSHFKRQNLLE